jgi:hypothetical protein
MPIRATCVDIRVSVAREARTLDANLSQQERESLKQRARTNELSEPFLEMTPTLAADGVEIHLKGTAGFIEALNPDEITEAQEAFVDAMTSDLHLQPFEFTFAANLWDGQSVAVVVPRDKRILVGRRLTKPAHRLVFLVRSTIISPAGDRVHTDIQLAFTTNSIPVQPNTGN